MKKLLSSLLCVALLVSVVGCGEKSFSYSDGINVISREAGSGTRGAFIELFGVEEKDASGNKVDKTSEDATVLSKTGVVITTVEQDLYSIGYVSTGSLSDSVKAVKIDGAEATTANIKNGSYAISRPFNIAVSGEATGVAKDFIDYILSKEGQEVVSGKYIAIDDNATAYAGNRPSGKITVAGSSSVSPLMQELIDAYKVINPNATIDLQETDSTSGMTSAIDGSAQIGMASRDLKESELAKLTSITIALDGIAVIVNKENPIDNLTKEEVKAIFTGVTTTWESFEK